MSEVRRGILRGSLYAHRLQGTEVEVEVTDEFWGRCHAHSTWVRLTDLEPIPAAVFGVDPAGDGPLIKFANGGIVRKPTAGITVKRLSVSPITVAEIKGSFQ